MYVCDLLRIESKRKKELHWRWKKKECDKEEMQKNEIVNYMPNINFHLPSSGDLLIVTFYSFQKRAFNASLLQKNISYDCTFWQSSVLVRQKSVVWKRRPKKMNKYSLISTWKGINSIYEDNEKETNAHTHTDIDFACLIVS